MLYIVPTPIGNLRDITLRALDVLKQVDLIVCEDTRHTQKLLQAYEIQKPLISFHEHSGSGRIKEIINKLNAGSSIALVTDGGTPLVSDPGFQIVHEAIQNNLAFEVLPGPSAVITALVASGLACDSFSFFGFLPQKSVARLRALESLKERDETLLFYESPFRLLKTLQEIEQVFGEREAVVARELTKKFEEVKRGKLAELSKHFSSKKVLGEIVIVVSGKDRKALLAHE
jgi:16S rRNA (cytidine1402-2'-O)-methyltransferase